MIIDILIVLLVVGFVVYVVDQLTFLAHPYPLLIKGFVILVTVIWLLNKYARPYLP